jgi:hypothetical protein
MAREAENARRCYTLRRLVVGDPIWTTRIATNEDAKKNAEERRSLAAGSEGLEVANESVSDVLWQSDVARAHFCLYRIHQRHE